MADCKVCSSVVKRLCIWPAGIGAAFLIFNSPPNFILPESNAFLPDRVGRRALRPGAGRGKVENHQCLPGGARTRASVLRGPRKSSGNRILPKNKILAPPEFLFFRRITIFQVPMLFSRRRGGDFAVGHHRQPARLGSLPILRLMLFDIINIRSGVQRLASGGDGRPGEERQSERNFRN